MQLWNIVLSDLKLQMTGTTFNQWLQDTTAEGPRDGVLVIHASQAVAQQWTVAPQYLEERLRIPVTRAAIRVYQQELEVHFQINGSKLVTADPEPKAIPNELLQLVADKEPVADDGSDLSNDHPEDDQHYNSTLTEVAFSHEEIVGYAKHSHYLVAFGRAYLTATPFDVWDFVRGHCSNSELIWTEPLEITGADLARGVGAHPQRIVGVWRNCARFDEAFFEGQPLIECCGQHPGAEMTIARPSKPFPQGRPICRYWVHGALEILEAEGWAVYQKYGSSPKNTFYTIQIYQHPPVLTPQQSSRLAVATQSDHRSYLRGMFKYVAKRRGLDWVKLLAHWDQYKIHSFMTLIERDQLLKGLTLPVPSNGVLSAAARNNIFFACDMCANEQNDN